jgi:hypothetical protein
MENRPVEMPKESLSRYSKQGVVFAVRASNHILSRLSVKALVTNVSLGTLAIVAICMVDLFLTMFAVLTGNAIEANPMLSWSFHYGPMMFALAKVASFIPGVWALEMCRLHNERFAIFASRAVVYGYMALYAFGSLHIHGLL